jgi:hypothetical protein
LKNGLNESGAVLKLGGDLTENTTISTQGFDFIILDDNGLTGTIVDITNNPIVGSASSIINLNTSNGSGGSSTDVISSSQAAGVTSLNLLASEDMLIDITNAGILNAVTLEINADTFDTTSSVITVDASTSFTITAPTTGVEYAADYSANYTNRTLVDKAYVDNAVGASTNSYGAFTDGTQTSTAVLSDTFKFRSANNILTVFVGNDDATHGDNLLLTIDETEINHDNLSNYVATEHVDHSAVSIATANSIIGGGDITTTRTLQLLNDTAAPGNNHFYGTDGSGTKGWQDLDAYVSSFYTFENGITETAGTVKLGGTLTENTTITPSGFGITIGDYDESGFFDARFLGATSSTRLYHDGDNISLVHYPDYSANNSNFSRVIANAFNVELLANDNDNTLSSSVSVQEDNINISSSDDTDTSSIAVTSTSVVIDSKGSFNVDLAGTSTITDNRLVGSQNGLQYAADYSVDFLDRSLVDKAYVDDVLSGISYTFTNGITESASTVRLGGTLTQNTNLDGDATYSWSVTDVPEILFRALNQLEAQVGRFVISSTGSLTIPKGNVAQRSQPETEGDFRYNTDTDITEIRQAGSWDNIGSGGPLGVINAAGPVLNLGVIHQGKLLISPLSPIGYNLPDASTCFERVYRIKNRSSFARIYAFGFGTATPQNIDQPGVPGYNMAPFETVNLISDGVDTWYIF